MVEPVTSASTRVVELNQATKVQPTIPTLASDAVKDGGSPLPEKDKQIVRHEIKDTEISAAIKQIADYVQSVSRELQFSVNAETQKTVIRVINPETGELVRTIPLDEAVGLAQQLQSGIDGLMLNVRA
jgi:flagellar protein FlaG